MPTMYAANMGSTLTGLRRTHAADLGNVGLNPASNIVIDVTGAGVKVSNTAFDGIVIDVTGAGILIDITGAGLANKFRIR